MALINAYDKGDLVPLVFTFRNAAGALADPTTVVLAIRDPDGATTTSTPTQASTGVYTHDLLLTKSGLWEYRAVGSGVVSEAEEGALYARSTRF